MPYYYLKPGNFSRLFLHHTNWATPGQFISKNASADVFRGACKHDTKVKKNLTDYCGQKVKYPLKGNC